MKKLLIVNNNLLIGGIQKALIGLLNEIYDKYDITLLLFQKAGPLLDKIPSNIKIVETNSAYKYLGKKQKSWGFFHRIKRGMLVVLTRVFGFKFVIPYLNATVHKKECDEEFDVAISYMHNSSFRSFYGGAVNYVLAKIAAKQKICFIHCDYLNSGTANAYNNKLYAKFDKIICVSDSVKKNFNAVLPLMEKKTVVLYNALNLDELNELSKKSYEYDPKFVNFITVARLSQEKGVERAILAFSRCTCDNCRYYIIGDGSQRLELEHLIREKKLERKVFLLGEQINPYCYMIGADWLMVPSYHEAAPMVFQEAAALHLPVLTTETSSAREMVSGNLGIVVDNTIEGIVMGIEKACEQLSHYKILLKDLEYSQEEYRDRFQRILFSEK